MKRSEERTSVSWPWMLTGLVVLTIGIAMIAPAAGAMLFGESAVGTVVERIDSRRDPSLPGDTYAVVVEFRTRNGVPVRVRRLLSDEGYLFSGGDAIPVVYFRSRPEDAKIKLWRAEWATGGVLGLFGCAIIAAGATKGRRTTGS